MKYISGKLLTKSPVIYVKKQRIYYILKFFQHVRNMHFKGALLQKRIFSDFLNRQFLLGFSNLIEWHMSDPMFSPRVQVTFRRRRGRVFREYSILICIENNVKQKLERKESKGTSLSSGQVQLAVKYWWNRMLSGFQQYRIFLKLPRKRLRYYLGLG